MRILVISQYYYPEQFRVTDICEELVKRGNEVTVVTGLPNYPEGEIYPGYEFAYKKIDELNGVKIVRCKLRPRHKGKINLALNYISFAIQANKAVRKIDNNFDAVYVYEISPITLAIPAIKYKRKYHIPIYLYCCDIWPECVRDTDGEPIRTSHPIYILAKWVSKYVYKRMDRIGVKCNQFTDYLHEVCDINRGKCALLYEHAEDSYLEIPDEPEDNGCYDFMFLGNIGLAQHCDYIIKAAERITSQKPFKVHFVGSGSGLGDLQKYVKEKKLDDKVVFHGRHPVSEINKFYGFADCCMLTLSAKTATGLTPPAKLAGYMAASRPIIAAAVGASEDIIREADCGICVDSENIEGLSQSMIYALEHQDEFKEKGKNGRRYFKKNFTLDKHVNSLERELKYLVGGK